MKWQSPEFEQLQEYWYELLEAEGFVDIERKRQSQRDEPLWGTDAGEENDHLDPRNNRISPINHVQTRATSRQIYFAAVSASLESWTFKSSREVDRHIMTLHAEGKTLEDIRNKLSLIGYKRGIPAIHFIIRQYLMLWGIKTFTPKQLNCTIEQLKAKIPRTA